ncbi:hypothetical protein IGI49_003995 [Enterococcus sp. AZ071]
MKVAEGKDVSVVFIPSFELFQQQTEAYKNSFLPKEVTARVSIEMDTSFGWGRYVGAQGKILSIDKFGMSALGDTIIKEYGFTVESVMQVLK